jgi:putative DNA primase/helicase
MTAETVAKALGGRKAGSAWMARCPAHADREPSLSITDAENGKVLVRCHAGCDQQHVIAALKARGIWSDAGRSHSKIIGSQSGATNELHRSDAKRTEAALRIWRATVPADGTMVETYLRSRGSVMPVPATLRFHAAIKHPHGQLWPAMVALVTRGEDDTPLAIHRTFIARDGGGKAPVEPQKMMLGPCSGSAVRLAPPGDLLMVGEGIETCIAAMQATDHPAWAALSASGLRALELPTDVREVVVLADGDDPGEAAARDAALRWSCEGRRVRIARPPRGFDFNDVLVGRTTPIVGGLHVAT